MVVAPSADVVRLFTHRVDQYALFMRAVFYPQGLRAYFRAAPFLQPHLRVLDAGCGTGAVSLAFRNAMLSRGFALGPMHGFDLTPAMLERFKTKLAQSTSQIELRQADVLRLETLPHEPIRFDRVCFDARIPADRQAGRCARRPASASAPSWPACRVHYAAQYAHPAVDRQMVGQQPVQTIGAGADLQPSRFQTGDLFIVPTSLRSFGDVGTHCRSRRRGLVTLVDAFRMRVHQ